MHEALLTWSYRSQGSLGVPFCGIFHSHHYLAGALDALMAHHRRTAPPRPVISGGGWATCLLCPTESLLGLNRYLLNEHKALDTEEAPVFCLQLPSLRLRPGHWLAWSGNRHLLMPPAGSGHWPVSQESQMPGLSRRLCSPGHPPTHSLSLSGSICNMRARPGPL